MPFSLTTLAPRRAASGRALTARGERARLRASLDSYRTSSERAELNAILSRSSADDRDALARLTGRREWAA